MDVVVAQSSQECGARKRGGSGTDEGDLCLGHSRIKGCQVGVTNLFDFHLFEDLAGKFLELTNLNGSSLEPVCVASRGAELTDGAKTSATKTERVIRENSLGCTVVVLVLDLIDERTDIDSNRACFLAGAIGTFHAPGGLSHSFLFGVDPVMERPSPIVSEILGRNSLMFDFMFTTVLLASAGVDNLGVVELRSGGEDVLDHLLRIFGQTEAVESAADQATQHQ